MTAAIAGARASLVTAMLHVHQARLHVRGTGDEAALEVLEGQIRVVQEGLITSAAEAARRGGQ
jgi:hypothetical protein